jgi:predicted nucleic acid-binding protein
VAKLRNASVLTNDKEARKLAAELRIEFSSTLGILRHAVAARLFGGPDAIRILDQMIENGSWFGSELVEEFKQNLQ